MKSPLTFAPAGVSALTLLSACDGRGSGGNPSAAPLPALGDRGNLPANVYSGGGGATQINRDTLLGHYSSINSGGSGCTDPGSNLLTSGSGDGAAGSRTIRDSADYLSSPSFVTYTILAGATVASVESVRAFGHLLATSEVLMVDGKPVTVGLSDSIKLRDITGPSSIPGSDSYNARGSFYGPGAENAAGGTSQTASGAGPELGFIGKQ